ncbi:hypothetical protein LshimejAT787_0304860 [Lyophyllum shimeji]|uniref:N-acetyltransferase domain-containing protein n=1 Tax=Lyophyllum shimeji TaxID=47721 RepID=A0A9P3PIR9_LYOSH|nr:hypothetical protein LshimejAT787_0304860 [Lyophyllum shimeji]
MAERDAQIRRFKASDDKLVRFTIGKASMESLAVANHRAYVHPFTVVSWLVLSYLIIDYMHLWPTDRYGLLGYVQPLPMLAACAVPLMFLIDWFNRPVFEELVQEVLHGPDMTDIGGYYSRSPASGFWILEYGGLFVGLIALDATTEPSDAPVIPSTAVKQQKVGKKLQTKGSSSTAIIRHFYVDEAYRSTAIQEDLLTHAVRFAFDADPALQVIRAPDSPLIPYIRNCLRDASFALEDYTRKVGVFRWQLGTRVLGREDWEAKKRGN